MLSKKELLPRMALDITAATKSLLSSDSVVISSVVIAATALPFTDGADFLSFFRAFPHVLQVMVIFLYDFPSGKSLGQLYKL